MKFSLSNLTVEGCQIEKLEIEGNMSEYLQTLSAVQTQGVKNLGELISTLVAGSRAIRTEVKDWMELEVNEEALESMY